MAYTKKEVATLNKLAETNGSVTYEDAVALSEDFGKSVRSVISKVKSLDLPYTPKAKPAKREKGLTKAELVAQVAENLGVEADVLAGLEKSTARAIGKLVELT